MKLYRYIFLFICIRNFTLPGSFYYLSAQDSPVAPITSALKTKLYTEIEKYTSQRKDESIKLIRMRSGIEKLLVPQNLNSDENELRARKLKRIQLFLLNEISMLQGERRILLNQNDALISLKIRYEVEAIIMETDRQIFNQYSQFIQIKVNALNRSIRAREALLNRIYRTLKNEESNKDWWNAIVPGVGIIIVILWAWRFFQT